MNKTALSFAALLLFSSAVASAQQTIQPTGPSAVLSKFQTSFEVRAYVPAKDFVPPNLMSGRLHRVEPDAYNDGLRNTYVVVTDFDAYEVTGTHELYEFVREIYALDYLRGVSKTEEFGKAIADAGKQKIESVVDLVKNPVRTIKNVPKGASRFFGRIGEGLKGGKSQSESGGLAVATGVAKAKVELAVALGINPYSTNEILQAELSSVARAKAGGGLIITGATAAVGGGFGTALSAVGMNQTLQSMLVGSTPEDMRSANRKKLAALRTNKEVTEEFLMHPWFSPWHETITTDALSRIGVTPTAFLSNACRALSADDASYFQRNAQILARYAEDIAAIRSLRTERGMVCGVDKNGTLVVPVSLDYAIWSEGIAERAAEFRALVGSTKGIKSVAFCTDGRVSERFAQELKKHGITCRVLMLEGGKL